MTATMLLRHLRTMKRACLWAGASLWAASASHGQPHPADIPLRGFQDGHYDRAEYIVDSTITVPAGKTMVIAAGTIVRFKRYAQICVDGRLECQGTNAALVLFTADDHRVQGSGKPDPAPFGWNGILISASGSARFSYTRVAYSTFGIKSAAPMDSLVFDNVAFSHNGTQSLSVVDSVFTVPESKMASFGVAPPQPVPPAATAAVQPAAASPDAKPREGGWRWPARIGAGAVLVAGGGAAAYFHMRASDNEQKYGTAAYPLADTYKKEYRTAVILRDVGIGVAVLGVAGLSVTFVF